MERGFGIIIAFVLAVIVGFLSGEPGAAGVVFVIAQVVYIVVRIMIRENTTETHITPNYTSQSKPSGYTGAKRPGTPNRQVPPKKTNTPLFKPEEVLDVAAIPDGTELTPQEQVILKSISNRAVSAQEIFNKIPRSANIHDYKEAFTHLEEIGAIKLMEDNRYVVVLSEQFLQQKAANEMIEQELQGRQREKEEKARQQREAEIRKNAVYFKEDDLTPQEKFVLSMLSKKSFKAQDILRVVPRGEEMTPYKDAINNLKELGAITANPDGTLSYNETFFILSGSEEAPEVKEEIKVEEAKPLETKVEKTEDAIFLGLVSAKEEVPEVKEEIKVEETKPVEENKDEETKPVEETKAEDPVPEEKTVETSAEANKVETPAESNKAEIPAEEKKTEAPASSFESKSEKNISIDDLTEEDVERLAQNAGNIVAMFKDTFSSGFGLDIEKALMFSAGMAGYACHQAVIANKEPFMAVSMADNKKFYMGDAVNKYLMESKYNVLGFCDGFFELKGLGMTKPDPIEIVKREAKVLGDKGYRIWDKIDPAVAYKEVKACWEGIYSNMTGAYCKSPSEWPVLYGIVLQNIMIEAAKVTTVSRVYNMAVECVLYISKMDDDSI